MAKKLRAGDCIHGYEILDLLNQGALALAYAARSSSGEKVFLKQYKSPSVTLPWYRGYVEYQQELKRRIESTPAKRFSYRFVDFFEAEWGHRCYFQVFEFVERGHDLEEIFNRVRERPDGGDWSQRVTFAKVIMAGVHALHEAGVIHSDLKPANLQLFEDTTVRAGYVLKLIDMDYSVLHERQAPWHGHQGYVGSPGYYSPEHLGGGSPFKASDVFTCGLILYELLGHGHPYRFDDPEQYSSAVLSYSAAPPRLLGRMPEPAVDADVVRILHRCLSPDPAARPTASEVNLVLNGKPASRPVGGASTPAPDASASGVRPAGPLRLIGPKGYAVSINVRTLVGRYLCRPFGEDAQYFADQQFILDRLPNGQWAVEPDPTAKHETMLNGKAVFERTPLHNLDVLGVGREAKGIVKLPLTVQLG